MDSSSIVVRVSTKGTCATAQAKRSGRALRTAPISRPPALRPRMASFRGFVYPSSISSVAHAMEWYKDGKFLCKTNTLDDFIACATELIEEGYTNPRKLAIRGRSAGGLLIGAVLNARPYLFACAVAQVPFVDTLTTMLDESIPLTVNEYEEWGDPNDPEFY